jgi:hypothetical protein
MALSATSKMTSIDITWWNYPQSECMEEYSNFKKKPGIRLPVRRPYNDIDHLGVIYAEKRTVYHVLHFWFQSLTAIALFDHPFKSST